MSDDYRDHAVQRAKQRAVPPLVVQWLLDYGVESHDKRGCTIHYFDKRARRQLEKDIGREPVKRMKDKLGCYLVRGADGRVITAGHRTRRFHRK